MSLQKVVLAALLIGPGALVARAHAQQDAGAPLSDAAAPVAAESLQTTPEPLPVDPEPTTAQTTLSDAELQGLLGVEEPTYPNLSWYGFADLSFAKMFSPKRNLISLYAPTQSSFAIGNVNLYADSQISRRARSLVEVRLSFMPDGSLTLDPATAGIRRENTDVADTRILGRITSWGSIYLERVVISYDVAPWLTLSAGRLITPWGLWNIDHGTPSLITVLSPLFIDGQYIPTRQTGIQASGQWAFQSVRVGYYLTLSNGRGPVESYRDFDENKAFGGRLYTTFNQRGDLTLGFSWYVGRATDPVTQYVRPPLSGDHATVDNALEVRSLEKSLSGDLKWEYRGALVMTEFVATGRTYDNNHRGPIDPALASVVTDGRKQIASDSLRYGGYVLVGYRFKFLGTMPFFDFEYNHDTEAFLFPRLLMPQLGINMRPEPGLVLKVMGGLTYFKDAQPKFFGEQPKFWYFHTQVAWAF